MAHYVYATHSAADSDGEVASFSEGARMHGEIWLASFISFTRPFGGFLFGHADLNKDKAMYVSDADILHVAHGLRDRTLPKTEWTHAAHFAAAVWLIRSAEYDAERDMPGLILAYNSACGVKNSDTEGYHETITLASIRMAAHLLDEIERDTPLFQAVNHIIASGLDRSEWILKHWSRDVLFSVKARREWVQPDLAPLP